MRSENSSKKENPLEELIIEVEFEIEKILANILKPFIRFDRKSKNIVFLDLYYACKELKADVKILLGLAAIYALYKLGWRESPSIQVKELSKLIDINYNTVRSRLSKGDACRYVERVSTGEYKLNEAKIRELEKYILNYVEKCTGELK